MMQVMILVSPAVKPEFELSSAMIDVGCWTWLLIVECLVESSVGRGEEEIR